MTFTQFIWLCVIVLVAVLWYAGGIALAILGAIGLAILYLLVRIDERNCNRRD